MKWGFPAEPPAPHKPSRNGKLRLSTTSIFRAIVILLLATTACQSVSTQKCVSLFLFRTKVSDFISTFWTRYMMYRICINSHDRLCYVGGDFLVCILRHMFQHRFWEAFFILVSRPSNDRKKRPCGRGREIRKNSKVAWNYRALCSSKNQRITTLWWMKIFPLFGNYSNSHRNSHVILLGFFYIYWMT